MRPRARAIFLFIPGEIFPQHNLTMKLLVSADELSAAKIVEFDKGADTSLKESPVAAPMITRTLEPEAGSFKGPSAGIVFVRKHEGRMYVARRNGKLECLEDKSEWDHVECPIGFEIVHNYLLTCSATGIVRGSQLGEHKTTTLEIDLGRSNLQAWTVTNRNKLQFVSGGDEKDLEVVELDLTKQTAKSIWQARNVKNNHLDLRVPINITSVLILHDTTNNNTTLPRIVTGTKLGQLRVYDPETARRPIIDIKASKYCISSLCVGPTESTVIYSDAHSTIATFDIAKKSIGSKFTGATGCVKALENFAVNGYLISGGLDRYIRVYDIRTRTCVSKVYTGTQIMTLAVLEGDDEFLDEKSSKRSRSGEAENENDDEFWDKLAKKAKK